MSEVKIVKAATCEEDGLKESHCLREGCNEKKEEKINKLGHEYSDTVLRPADCTHTGEKSRVCTRESCGKKTVEEIPALGHSWNTGEIDVQPTCTTPGRSPSGTCTRCGITGQNIEIPMLGHNMVPVSGEYATCTQPGKNVYQCSRCDHKEEEIIEPLGHDLSTFLDKEATCYSDGKSHSRCSRSNCNYEFESVLPKVGHDYTISHWKKRPTCTDEGIRKPTCRFCGTEKEPETVPANGHDWQELEILSYPTCNQEGRAKHLCLTCGDETEYPLEKVQHRYGDYAVDTPATAEQEGKMSRHCVYCGDSIEEMPIPRVEEKVEYEIRLLRENGMEYSAESDSGYQNLQYQIYRDDTLLETISVDACTIKRSISKHATKLKVTGLNRGYTALREEISLDPGSPIVSVFVRGALQKGKMNKVDGKMVAEKPEELNVGDPMYDFYVYDTMNPGNSKPLSEMMEGKKLVFLDFFHTHCGFCTHYMKLFSNVYKRALFKYKDDMLVLMLDVMSYESDETINIYRRNESYLPDDFISTSCNYGGMNVREWFSTEKHHVATPGHVWLDSEGIIYYMDVKTTEEQFVELVEGYFDKLTVAEREKTNPVFWKEAEKPYIFDRRRY